MNNMLFAFSEVVINDPHQALLRLCLKTSIEIQVLWKDIWKREREKVF